MEGSVVRWILAGFAIAVAAGLAGVVIVSLKHPRPAIEAGVATEALAPEPQPVT